MPELPEVETIARTLEPLIKDATITGVHLHLPSTQDHTGSGSLDLHLLQGRRISHVSRRGKLALIGLSPLSHTPSPHEAHMLAVHLKMTGRLFVYDAHYPQQKHTRLSLDLHYDGSKACAKQLFFDDARTFGYVRLVSPATLPSWPFWQKLGLEPLEHTAEQLAHCYVGKKAGIKGLLLKQELVVGIGNIYADEALFQSSIHPERKAHTLSFEQLNQLMHAVQAVLRLSIEQCGSSIRDYRDAHGDAGSFQNTFMVYGRSGQACKACACALITKRIAGRTTVYCEHCQK